MYLFGFFGNIYVLDSRYLRICVFCCQTSDKSRNFFDNYQLSFSESSSFSNEKTTKKISGPVNELFS